LMILHKGKVVEQGKTEDIFKNPKSKYTKQLIDATLL